MKTESGEDLKPLVESMAAEFGYKGDCRFAFRFPEIGLARTPTYNPDCVWFSGTPSEHNAVAIFEIDQGPSRKHRVGGVALANVIALKYSKRLFYFAIAPANRAAVATPPIELHSRYLGDKWRLQATLIASFDPGTIRQRVTEALTKAQT